MSDPTEEALQPHLGVFDGISIIIGIVVGVSIFRTTPMVFSSVPDPWWAMGVWVLGGGLTLCGALCYAELGTRYPQTGGDYVYLTRAYSPLVGFLFGWAQLVAILTGSIGAMAYVFADYATQLWGLGESSSVNAWLAAAVVVVLSLLNLVSSSVGKRAQNLLTVAKVLG